MRPMRGWFKLAWWSHDSPPLARTLRLGSSPRHSWIGPPASRRLSRASTRRSTRWWRSSDQTSHLSPLRPRTPTNGRRGWCETKRAAAAERKSERPTIIDSPGPRFPSVLASQNKSSEPPSAGAGSPKARSRDSAQARNPIPLGLATSLWTRFGMFWMRARPRSGGYSSAWRGWGGSAAHLRSAPLHGLT